MSITLDALTLPYEMLWEDEFAWTGIVESAQRTLGGVNIVELSETAGDSGKPITLFSDNAWIERTDLLTLLSMAETLNKVMTLTLHDGRTFQVRFRELEKPVIEVENILKNAEPDSTDEYILRVKLVVQ